MHNLGLTSRDFVATVGTATAATLLGAPTPAQAADSLPAVRLKSWRIVERPAAKEKFRFFVQITGDNGAVGYCRALGDVKDIGVAQQAVTGADLLDHEKLYDLLEDIPKKYLDGPHLLAPDWPGIYCIE